MTESGTSTKTEDRDFYVAQDGMRGRDGGPYLDQIEREQAEIRRARVEDREPDFDDPGPTTGTVLVTGTQLTDNVQSNPSMTNQVEETAPVSVNEDLVTPLTLAVDTSTEAPEEVDTETSASPQHALPESDVKTETQPKPAPTTSS